MTNLTVRLNTRSDLQKYLSFAQKDENADVPVTDIGQNEVKSTFFGMIKQYCYRKSTRSIIAEEFLKGLKQEFPEVDFASHFLSSTKQLIIQEGLKGRIIAQVIQETSKKAYVKKLSELITSKVRSSTLQLELAEETTHQPETRIKAAKALLQLKEEIDHCVDELKKDINGFILTQDLEEKIKTQQDQVKDHAEVATEILKKLQRTRLDDYDREIPESTFLQIAESLVKQDQVKDHADVATEILKELQPTRLDDDDSYDTGIPESTFLQIAESLVKQDQCKTAPINPNIIEPQDRLSPNKEGTQGTNKIEEKAAEGIHSQRAATET